MCVCLCWLLGNIPLCWNPCLALDSVAHTSDTSWHCDGDTSFVWGPGETHTQRWLVFCSCVPMHDSSLCVWLSFMMCMTRAVVIHFCFVSSKKALVTHSQVGWCQQHSSLLEDDWFFFFSPALVFTLGVRVTPYFDRHLHLCGHPDPHSGGSQRVACAALNVSGQRPEVPHAVLWRDPHWANRQSFQQGCGCHRRDRAHERSHVLHVLPARDRHHRHHLHGNASLSLCHHPPRGCLLPCTGTFGALPMQMFVVCVVVARFILSCVYRRGCWKTNSTLVFFAFGVLL